MSGILFIVSAPSCAGKTSLVKAVIEKIKERHNFDISQYVTYTTKSPRSGTQGSKEFHFISEKEFEQKQKAGFFIEWSNAYHHYYGTPRTILNDLSQGKSYIIILDRAGMQQVVQQLPEAVTIWISVSSIAELERRIVARGRDSDKQVKLRLALAQEEMAQEAAHAQYKFCIKNDDFQIALGQIEQIILSFLKKV